MTNLTDYKIGQQVVADCNLRSEEKDIYIPKGAKGYIVNICRDYNNRVISLTINFNDQFINTHSRLVYVLPDEPNVVEQILNPQRYIAEIVYDETESLGLPYLEALLVKDKEGDIVRYEDFIKLKQLYEAAIKHSV
jgi:hypothetical protein